jgi:predicted adenylyl cyclase CyaB
MTTDGEANPRRNLERKARHRDLVSAAAALAALGARREGVQAQVDTYFHARSDRLKLRVRDGGSAELIAYDRPDEGALRLSRYHLVPAGEPVLLRAALAAALGVRGEVRKRREVWHWHNVRIHLDEVEGLGTFVEFEAVLSDAEDEATATGRLDHLGRVLGLTPADDVKGSYADLLGL